MTNKKAIVLYYIFKSLVYVIVCARIVCTLLAGTTIAPSDDTFFPYVIPSVFAPPAFLFAIQGHTHEALLGSILIAISIFSVTAYPTTFLFGMITFKTNKFDMILFPIMSVLGISDLVLMLISIQDSFYSGKLISCIISIVFILITGILIFINIRFKNNQKSTADDFVSSKKQMNN